MRMIRKDPYQRQCQDGCYGDASGGNDHVIDIAVIDGNDEHVVEERMTAAEEMMRNVVQSCGCGLDRNLDLMLVDDETKRRWLPMVVFVQLLDSVAACDCEQRYSLFFVQLGEQVWLKDLQGDAFRINSLCQYDDDEGKKNEQTNQKFGFSSSFQIF
mmetsp:Transcript_117514/g.165232  ORF Transcript_117514/g.165232 Transcript_117514/m.165232 type:complete len:157 (+) Transcript_117514:122-592(+)